MFLNISLLVDHRYSKTVAYYCEKMIPHFKKVYILICILKISYLFL